MSQGAPGPDAEWGDARVSVRSTARMRLGLHIPMRDGVLLNAVLYLPPGDTPPAPCVLSITPYTAARNHLRARYIAGHGFAFIAVDSRGRGNSEGTFRPFIQEAQDGYDIVEWIARQPFCNGKVAMFSGSYEGYVQWATAKEFPPHLASIAPAAAAAPGIDMTLRNNISFPYLMQWLSLVSERTLQETMYIDQAYWRDNFSDWYTSGRPFRELDAIVGNPSPTFQEWLAHPRLDEYWDAYLPTAEQFARIDLPILTITGCYDVNQLGALHHYREHLRNASPEAAARHYLIVGPWDHTGILLPKIEFGGVKFGPAAVLDMMKLNVDWYDWTLRAGPKPDFLKNNVAYYVMGADEWRYAKTLDEVTAYSRVFYLDSSGKAAHAGSRGTLGERPAAGAPDSYVYDPRDTRAAAVESRHQYSTAMLPIVLLRPIFPADSLVDQSLVDANDGRVLVYESAELPADAEISGFFKLSAWLSIDQPDTDFLAAVYELTADGGSILLTSDVMRARHRESLREERLIDSPAPLLYEFNRFTFVSRKIKGGHRLRLAIGPIDSVFHQKNYNSGMVVAEESMADARPVKVRLYHDEAHPSALEVPFGRAT